MRFVSSVPLSLLLLLQGGALVGAAVERQKIQVVYAGFGRTGTHSLGHALEKLGYNPIHGETICRQTAFDGPQTVIADAVIRGDYDALLDETEKLGFNATLDIHGMFWREIMERRPDAKFIFMTRDKHKLRHSLRELDWYFGPIYRYPMRFFPGVEKLNSFLLTMGAFMQGLPMKDCFKGTQADLEARLEAAYDRFNEELPKVLETHPHNTILFDMKEGYPALCKFLEVDEADCPKEPFPHLGSKWEFRYRGVKFRMIEASVAFWPLYFLYWVWKKLFGPSTMKKKVA